MGRLDGRVALVTGSSSGIGAATARRFAEEGARVAGFDQNPAPDGGPELFREGDVRDEAQVAAVVRAAIEELGGLDVVVNSAGVGGGGPVHQLSAEAWDRVIDINLKGTFLVCKHALAHMVEQRSGSIVNIASIEGLEGVDGGSAYNASKGGVVLLTRNLAIDYGRRGIRANCICPGLIDTPLTAGITGSEAMRDFKQRFIDAHHLGRLGRPEEIAAAALFLASDDASFVTGHALAVDGGVTAGHAFGARKMMGLE
ncbi:MAG: SDR family NAD(P)-dependent oxidoreductase [Proteobacteria bacterium]|nr:SDR family NAD(P)-dependent oxidoreductase [Pseudomonadota bacterium]